ASAFELRLQVEVVRAAHGQRQPRIALGIARRVYELPILRLPPPAAEVGAGKRDEIGRRVGGEAEGVRSWRVGRRVGPARLGGLTPAAPSRPRRSRSGLAAPAPPRPPTSAAPKAAACRAGCARNP